MVTEEKKGYSMQRGENGPKDQFALEVYAQKE